MLGHRAVMGMHAPWSVPSATPTTATASLFVDTAFASHV